ncbi:MAG: SRPBCC family protein [Pseudomonadota bacterium]
MNTNTVTAYFNAPREKVFAYVADIENLPRWATGYCKELRKEGDDHKVVTPLGELYFRIDADPITGVVDMVSGPEKETMAAYPVRVAAMPDGGSLLLFTAMQLPGMSGEDLAAQCRGLEAEFEIIRQAVE